MVTESRKRMDMELETGPEPRGSFRCGICKAEFETIEDLRAHQRAGHLR